MEAVETVAAAQAIAHYLHRADQRAGSRQEADAEELDERGQRQQDRDPYERRNERRRIH